MVLKFSHIGIPTLEKKEQEQYEALFNLYRTDASFSLFHMEFLRFREKLLLPEILKTSFHVGMETDSLEEVLKMVDEVIVPIVELPDQRICFVRKDQMIFELIQKVGAENEKIYGRDSESH